QGGGASTITQQLARALLLSPEERAQRTYTRKTREIILAAEITRRYTKDEILELYLNEIYYGNLAYGIEAAAETYFGKTAKDLTLGEAAFLAGLPQSPAVYDIYTNPEVTLTRQQQVLVLMFELSQAENCIEVSNSEEKVCVDPLNATEAANQIKSYPFTPPTFGARYPHWVNYVRAELEKLYDAQTIYRSGFVVYTTIDPVLQDRAQQLVTEQVAAMIDSNAKNGALVSIRPSTGEILAMIGSPDFSNAAIAGQINMAISPTRQPGSSIKPITYVAAFEKGWTPSTWIWDVPTQFPDGANPPYEPRNYDGKFHGGMTLRTALANSFNIPAVKALEFVGIYDNPDTPEKEGMIGM
ncbi:MAG TPA: penicillin-binding protein, partial [Anaerolineae bacterium]|nr:penicillin-binding protein [Anaerolineae bacterium]